MISMRCLHLTRCLGRKNILLTFARSMTMKQDPGVRRRKKLLKPSDEDVELENFDVEGFESDFMEAHHSYGEHMKEVNRLREKEKYLIVRQKYFKERFPNFLTWHDKEQIRYLHGKDPEEWTIEVLSEGFPALPSVIKKILKANYKKTDPKSIEKHDNTVEKNWEEFRRGKMENLPAELQEHLKKFTDRKLNFNAFEIPQGDKKIIKTVKNEPGEFSEIILSYEKLKNKNKPVEETFGIKENDLKDSIEEKSKSKKERTELLTFSELRTRMENQVIRGEKISEDAKLILKSKQKVDVEIKKMPKEDISSLIELQKDQSKKVAVTSKNYSHLIYPEKIRIPKDLYQPRNTYKLNDCYYDSDGSFLYRVPGIYK